MPNVLACIDASSYAESVCDHAAWTAGLIEGRVDVLHVDPPELSQPSGQDLVQEALDRLHDNGVETACGRVETGEFVATAAKAGAALIVMGKRGASGEHDRRRLGSNVEIMIRATDAPLCLASRIFLPIAKVLVLLDADMNHRTAVEFVAAYGGLQRLEIDLVIAAEEVEDAAPKLEWARQRLAARDADVFAMQADGPDAAAMRYMETRGADLLVISRAVLLPALQSRLQRITERALWGWRTTVLVC